ncbi:hypothetical protein AB6A40_003671 [Gnathostoma spinigerum]|uniref:Uncharacterized protein n=1 Tax=Gnathostoma spinigerum TaxID=75299 RepID=A0ABD6ECH6_9BILA
MKRYPQELQEIGKTASSCFLKKHGEEELDRDKSGQRFATSAVEQTAEDHPQRKGSAVGERWNDENGLLRMITIMVITRSVVRWKMA